MSRVLIRGLEKHFPGVAAREHKRGAIDGLDLDIAAGEFFVLLGPSGCGKTTTLRCIAGLEEPTSGSVTIGEQVAAHAAEGRFVPPHRRGVGMMFQSYALWPHMSVFQNVAYPLQHLRPRPARRKIGDTVARTLATVGLDGFGDRRPTELSGGQQQRVALARAIVASPRVVLFDEPLSNLDAQLRARLRQDLSRVHRETGATFIYVTHDQVEALALADRIAIMRSGRVEQVGRPEQIYMSPTTRFVARFVGYDNILPGVVLGVTNGKARLRPDGWNVVLTGRPAGACVNGQRGFAAFRADTLRLDQCAAGEHLGEARIDAVHYHGDHYRLAATLGGVPIQGVVRASLAATAPIRGQALFPRVATEDVVILPDDAEDRVTAVRSAA